jgi:hypothetical protein
MIYGESRYARPPNRALKKAFNSDKITVTNDTIHICIALSALGNLIGVVFTNGRGTAFSLDR